MRSLRAHECCLALAAGVVALMFTSVLWAWLVSIVVSLLLIALEP